MKYYVTADTHGFYTLLQHSLKDAGFFDDPEPHKLIILGDIMDRGHEAKKMQKFILELMKKDEVILVKGNHEDLMEDLAGKDEGCAFQHHVANGTFATAIQLTGYDKVMSQIHHYDFAEAIGNTAFVHNIIPRMIDYYETEHYIFVHGWIPCNVRPRYPGSNLKYYEYVPNWREGTEKDWRNARWINGMEAAKTCIEEGKTIVCGHWHTSYGHCQIEGACPEFGKGADFSPYQAPGILALDACTAYSHLINVVVIED